MFNKLMALIETVKLLGYITNVSMSANYASIDFHNGDTKYLLTLMATKEENENDPV